MAGQHTHHHQDDRMAQDRYRGDRRQAPPARGHRHGPHGGPGHRFAEGRFSHGRPWDRETPRDGEHRDHFGSYTHEGPQSEARQFPGRRSGGPGFDDGDFRGRRSGGPGFDDGDFRSRRSGGPGFDGGDFRGRRSGGPRSDGPRSRGRFGGRPSDASRFDGPPSRGRRSGHPRGGSDLRVGIQALMGAIRQVGMVGDEGQRSLVLAQVEEATRSVYRILAAGPQQAPTVENQPDEDSDATTASPVAPAEADIDHASMES